MRPRSGSTASTETLALIAVKAFSSMRLSRSILAASKLSAASQLVGVAFLATVLFPSWRTSTGLSSNAVASPPAWEVYFSPKGGAAEAIIVTLAKAKDTILVQAYSFTSAPLAKALLEAHGRGVNVQVVLDKSQRTEKYSSADFLAHAGIPVKIDGAHAIAHNKVMVIDDDTVITGSFNFTRAPEQQNAENLPIVHDPALAARYTATWQAHAQHSESYVGK